MEESLYYFTHEGVKEVTARHDRSDRSPPGSWELISKCDVFSRKKFVIDT